MLEDKCNMALGQTLCSFMLLLLALRFRRPTDLHLCSSCPCYCIFLQGNRRCGCPLARACRGCTPGGDVLPHSYRQVSGLPNVPTNAVVGLQFPAVPGMAFLIPSGMQRGEWEAAMELRKQPGHGVSKEAAPSRWHGASLCAIVAVHSTLSSLERAQALPLYPLVPRDLSYWGTGCSCVPMLMANVLFIISYFPLKWLHQLVAADVLSRPGFSGWMLHLKPFEVLNLFKLVWGYYIKG